MISHSTEQNNVLFGSSDPDSLSYPVARNSLIINSNDEILFGYTFNFDISFSPKKSYFVLGMLNHELELQWLKYYGGDAQYFLFDTKSTQDGGCIMLGQRY